MGGPGGREARCGMRASRVGEASHPGPRSDTHHSSQRQRLRRVLEDVLDALQFDLTQRRFRFECAGQSTQAQPTSYSTRFGRWPEPNVKLLCSRPSINGSEVVTERDPVGSTIRDGTTYRPTLADTSEIQSVEPPRQRRRLVLMPEPRGAPSARDVSVSDTESLHSDVRDGVSEGDVEVEHKEETPAPLPGSFEHCVV